MNCFTTQSLSDRSTALSDLLDGISNGVQTTQAANTGASKIADLVKSLQSTVTQAQSDAAANHPTVTGSALATAAEATGTSLRTTTMNMALGAAAARPSDTAKGSLGVAGAKLAITLTDGENTVTKSLDPTVTVGDLVDAINSSGLASASTGNSDKLQVGIGGDADAAADLADAKAQTGGGNALIGLTAPACTTGLTNDKTSAARTALASQFNDLRTQIDQIAKDAGFNGTNLLGGDTLTRLGRCQDDAAAIRLRDDHALVGDEPVDTVAVTGPDHRLGLGPPGPEPQGRRLSGGAVPKPSQARVRQGPSAPFSGAPGSSECSATFML